MASVARLLCLLLLALSTPGAAAAPPDRTGEQRLQWDRRPVAGDVSPDGRTLLLHRVQVTSRSGETSTTFGFRIYTPRGRQQRWGLLAESMRTSDGAEVHAHPRGFVVTRWAGKAYDVSFRGAVRTLDRRRGAVAPRAGDVLLRSGLAYRPRPRSLVRPERVAGGAVSHIDGQGTWWALGRPEAGMAVVWSARPGEEWVRHVVGAYSDDHNCTCVINRGPFGRGSVIAVSGMPLQHVSTDFGQTWTTYDLSGTEPHDYLLGIMRFPLTSALPDGRLVTGYQQYYLARDATNTTFDVLGRRSLAGWQSGLFGGVVVRGGRASADGGETWIDLER